MEQEEKPRADAIVTQFALRDGGMRRNVTGRHLYGDDCSLYNGYVEDDFDAAVWWRMMGAAAHLNKLDYRYPQCAKVPIHKFPRIIS
eukprot:645540-Pleurochrysis_carterae.AAC.1